MPRHPSLDDSGKLPDRFMPDRLSSNGLSAEVAAKVPAEVTKALAADSTMADAAASAAEDAVGTELATKDLITSSDPRVPVVRPVSQADLLHAHADSAGRRTWLEALGTDGGPTDWAVHLLRDRLGIAIEKRRGIFFSVADRAGRMTDLTVRDSDGQVPDWVIARWAERIVPRLPASGIAAALPTYADAPYVPGAKVLPVKTKTDAWAGWGSSTMEGASTALRTMLTAEGITYFNGGKGAEQIQHHAARMNARPALLTFPNNVIPASGAATVTVSNVSPTANMKQFAGVVAGVRGTLSASNTAFTFTRTTPGGQVPCPAGSPLEAEDGIAHRADTILLQPGKNNLTNASVSARSIADMAIQMYEYAAPLEKRVLMMGQFVNTGNSSPAIKANCNNWDAMMREYCGATFFDTTAWVTSAELWDMPGAPTPTEADLAEQALGNKPPSLSSDAGHFNTLGYTLYTAALKAHLTGLGWL